MRQFIDEALDRKTVGDVRHRAIPAHPRVDGGLRIFQADVGNRVGHVLEAHTQFSRALMKDIGRKQRGHARRHRAMQPAGGQAILAQDGLEVLQRNSVQIPAVKIVFPRPLHTHRPTRQGPGQNRSLDDVVRLGLATKPAPQQGDIDRDLFNGNPKTLGNGIPRPLGRLNRRPDLAAPIGETGDSDHRLHRCVGQVRHIVSGLKRAIWIRDQVFDLAVFAHHFTGLERGGLQLFAVGDRVVAGVGAVVPFDFQRLAPLDRCPGVAGDHRHSAQRLESGG
ncbi:hypothetical protein D3C76_786850 [compost metagenome]